MTFHKKAAFVLVFLVLFSSTLLTLGNAQAEDAYEENDTWETAWHPVSTWVRTWLSDISGLGVQADDDWYQIDVDPGATQIQVDCRFIHADGDIDIELYDSSDPPVRVGISDYGYDNEFIDVTIPSGGTYYIRVYCSDVGNTYDIRWDDLTEDAYEENNTLETAWHPGYNWERTYLANINGFGIQADDDWYRIDVDPGSVRVQIDCQFTHADGDINIALYDSAGTFLIESSSVTDDEFIDCEIPSGGTYYIRVYYSDVGNTYDLWWNDLSEDIYEENDMLETAWHPGYNWVRTWLSDIGVLGVQADDDWYRIDVDPGATQIQVDCQFIHADGDIDIELYDSAGTFLIESSSVTDDEFIDYEIVSGGTYYIRVYYSDVGNTYDLWWDDLVLTTTNLISDFGVAGLYEYDGSSTWSRLTASDAQYLATYGNKLVGDFGSAGLWEFDGSSWSKLTPTDPDNNGNCMVAYGTGLVIDFGGFGLYQYDSGAWSKLTTLDAQYLATYSNKLVVDFGGAGLWQFNGSSWSQLTSSDADNSGNCMVAYSTGLVIDFGSLGLYQYDGTWNKLTVSDPEYLAVYNGKLVGDFGADGLWEYDGSSWTQLTPVNPDNNGNCMVAYCISLVIDFGALSLYQYDDATWSKLTQSDAQYLATYGNKLVGDFGSAGLWEFNGSSWSKLTPSDPDNSGNCMMWVGFQ